MLTLNTYNTNINEFKSKNILACDVFNNNNLTNYNFSSYSLEPIDNIFIFYNIYCNEYTLKIIENQITKIIFSGLYKKVKTIYCFLAGNIDYINECKKFILKHGNKFVIAKIGINDKSYERFTLLEIKKYIKPNDKFLYIHSKGLSKTNNNNVTDWCFLMDYFLIYHNKICIENLDNYDIVGVNYYCSNDIPHFSGNYWWSTGKYYLTLPDYIGEKYTDPEFYIMKNNPKTLNLYSSNLQGQGHYFFEYNPKEYIDKYM